MDTGDVLVRVSGGAMLVSGLFNAVVAFLWFITMIWVCVGVFWLVPMAIALAQVTAGIVLVATGRPMKILAFASLMGPIASFCNVNFMAGLLDVVAILTGVGGFVVASQVDQIEDRLR